MMKKIKFSFSWIVLLLISSCSIATPTEKIDFPKTDIIYQAISMNFPGEPSNNLVGFVNADGSNNTLIKIKHRAHLPIFSKAWDGIFFINAGDNGAISQQGGILFFLGSNGEYRGCNTSDPFYGGSFVFPINLNDEKHILALNSRSIQLLSFADCKIIKTFLEQHDPIQNGMWAAYPSNTGDRIIFNFYDHAQQIREIKILDTNTGQTKKILEEGYNPSFSPDDKKITFAQKDGIYISDSNGANRQRLVSLTFPQIFDLNFLPTPFWSPDGTLLIYHKCINQVCKDLPDFRIYKVDIKSGKETKVIDQGLFPVWIK